MFAQSVAVLAVVLLAGGAQAIIGGDNVADSDLPYMVIIKSHKQVSNQHFACGGVIVSANTVLTSASCVSKFKSLYVVAGSHNIAKEPVSIEVDQVHLHEKFSKSSKNHDIAALKLKSALPIDQANIKAIHVSKDAPQDGSVCQIAGWGSIFPGSAMTTMTVKAADVKFISRESCTKTRHGSSISEDEVCARGDKTDACTGDEGGPLACNGKLAGLVSWGKTCNMATYPRVYANANYYKKWIKTMVATGNPSNLPDLAPITPDDADDDDDNSDETPDVPEPEPEPQPQPEPMVPSTKPVVEVLVKVLGVKYHYQSQNQYVPKNTFSRHMKLTSDDAEDKSMLHILLRYKDYKVEYKTSAQWHSNFIAELVQPLLEGDF